MRSPHQTVAVHRAAEAYLSSASKVYGCQHLSSYSTQSLSINKKISQPIAELRTSFSFQVAAVRRCTCELSE